MPRLVEHLIEQLVPAVEEAVRRDFMVRLDAVESVVQDVLIELYRRLCAEEPFDSLIRCLHLIVRDVRVNGHRKAARTSRNQGQALVEVLDTLPHSCGCSAEREVDFMDFLSAVLSRLPNKMQFAVRAVWIEGHTQKEVAVKLRISPSCLTRLLNRAAELLLPLLRPAAS